MLHPFRRTSSAITWPPGPLTPARINQCFALAVLLHILLVLVLGNTTGGLARPGEGVWGALNSSLHVTLSGPRSDPAAGAPRPPEIEPGPVGKAARQRFGGVVRPETPLSEVQEPGAAQLGEWQPQPAEPLRLPGEAPVVRPKFQPVTRPEEPAMRATPLAPLDPLPPLPVIPVPATLPAPVATPAPVESRPAPVLPAPAAVLTPVERQTPMPLEPPRSAPVLAPVPTMAPLPAAPIAPVLAPAPVLESLPAPAPTPTTAPATTTQAPSAAAPRAEPSVPPAVTAAPASTRATATTTTPSTVAAPPLGTPAGAPDAGTRLGRDVATAPSTPPDAPKPKLDLSLPRGGMVSRSGSRGVLALMPHPPERKSKVEESVEMSLKADCRKAYADKGLLAAAPLVLDAARDKGCRW